MKRTALFLMVAGLAAILFGCTAEPTATPVAGTNVEQSPPGSPDAPEATLVNLNVPNMT